MSGRIRSVKPEILEDAVTAGLSDMAYRIFTGIFVLCEDSGRFRAETGWLMGQIYWKRPVSVGAFSAAIQELVNARLVVLYEASGQRYGVVRTWTKHQKISHPAAARLPAPPWGDGDPPESIKSPSGGPPEVLRTDPDPDPDPDPDHLSTAPPGLDAPSTGGPDEVWSHYVVTLAQHRPRRRPTKLGPKDRKTIRTHLRDGMSIADLRRAVTGLFISPHHLGHNDRKTEYLELEYALRKPATFIALADDSEPPAPSTSSVRPVDTPAPNAVPMPDHVREKLMSICAPKAEPKRNVGTEFFDRLDAEDAANGVAR